MHDEMSSYTPTPGGHRWVVLPAGYGHVRRRRRTNDKTAQEVSAIGVSDARRIPTPTTVFPDQDVTYAERSDRADQRTVAENTPCGHRIVGDSRCSQ